MLTTNATFILLTGLPGDSESEGAYQEQVRDWLRILSEHRVQQCWVLCDQPAAFSSMNQPWLHVAKGDREHILSLPDKIGPITGPLVFVAGGHGGKQGSEPVFHVRGPRLKPEDLAGLAERFGKAPSRWILLFPGSGMFAQALSGPGRDILSSDNLTMSSSESVSVPLLIKAIKERPQVSLAEAASGLGQATAEWYEQRHLARTEEPTLWVQGNPPQRAAQELASSTTARSSAEHASDNSDQIRAEAANSGTNASGSQMSKSSSVDWKDIRSVSPDSYPDVDAVVLRSRQLFWLGNDPAMTSEREEFVQVLRPEGKRYGDFNVTFSPPQEELQFLTCEVRSPDGKMAVMNPEAIGISGEHSLGDYQGARRKFFSLPGVVPGSVLHIRFRSQWKEYPLPRVSMAIPVAREVPILEASLEVRLPKNWPFHFAVEGLPASEPGVSKSEYAATYEWHWSNIEADRLEPLSAPHRRPGLSISTYQDWREFVDWYSHITQLADEATPEIIAKAKTLTQEAKTDQDKVEALYNYVTALRYVAIPLGVNSVRPHAAANVLQNQFGDCKDKANLLNSLLHAVDIRAELVLVPRFSQADNALPGFAFNHAISRVVLGSTVQWLDTTDEVCRFGLLPPGDTGRNVLLVDAQTTQLTRLAAPSAGAHRLVLQGRMKFTGSGENASMSLTATGSGSVDYHLRSDAHETRQHSVDLPLLETRFYPVAGSFALERQTTSPLEAKDRDFRWQGEGTPVGLVSVNDDRVTFHSPVWLPKEWSLALNRRHSPLYLNDGYPIQIQEEFHIDLPPGAGESDLPEKAENKAGPLQWELNWSRPEPGHLVARFRAELVRGELSADQTGAFQDQVKQLMKALAADSSVSKLLAFKPRSNPASH